MFLMTIALPDTVSAPQARSSRPVGPATIRRRLKRWLGRLVDIGVELATGVRCRAACWRAQGGGVGTSMAGGPGRVDLMLARGLVERALRWSGALCERLAAEAQAAKAARKLENLWREPPERLNDWDEGGDDLDWVDAKLRRLSKGPPAEVPPPDPCIEGMPTGEVVEQICVDLGIVAVLFRNAALGEQIAAIAAEGHALLGGAGKPWTAPPIPPEQHPAAHRQQAEWDYIGRRILAAFGAPVGGPMSASAALPVPDTG